MKRLEGEVWLVLVLVLILGPVLVPGTGWTTFQRLSIHVHGRCVFSGESMLVW